MLSKRWDTAGRWCIYALLLIVFVGPFWGIVATAFSGAPVKPGELLAWPNQFSFENFIFAWMDIGVWQYLLNSILVVFCRCRSARWRPMRWRGRSFAAWRW